METSRENRIASLRLAEACLQEAAERLQHLCTLLSDESHKQECTEIANNISAQIQVISQEIESLLEHD